MLLRRTPLSTLWKSLILALGTIAVLGPIPLVLPAVLKALGRDTTLSGRTVIWQAYLPKALEHPILGLGPGSFTTPSQTTAELFFRLLKEGVIRTPHNMFIAVLGEAGFIGLAALLGPLFYIAFILPFRSTSATTLVCGAGAVLIMVNGLAETDMLCSPGLSLFIFIMLLSMREPEAKSERSDRPFVSMPTERSLLKA